MTQAEKASVDSVRFVPPALALRQRPGMGGMRSTFGTSTELLNVIRLMFSRLACHRCPNGHYHAPTIDVAAEVPFACDVCGARITPPSAEELAFNSMGACPTCQGTGIVRDVDDATLAPDDSLTIDEGAVVPWRTFGFNAQPDIVREFGVRTDVPFRELTDAERDIVFNGPEEKRHIVVTSVKGVHDLDFTFRNARLAVLKELERATDDKRYVKVAKFLVERTCPDCRGSRLSAVARAPRVGGTVRPDGTCAGGLALDEVSALPLAQVLAWADGLPALFDGAADAAAMAPMARSLNESLQGMGRRLMQLGLGYLTLDRAGTTLSSGERQRAQLARAVRNETTGVLYVLDEPSTGLHPANIEGLVGVMHDLLSSGNSVVFVDHDVHVLGAADHFIEMGPGAGTRGGGVIAQGTPREIMADPHSRIAGFLAGTEPVIVRERRPLPSPTSDDGWIRLEASRIHTVHPLRVAIPRGCMTAVTGVSGSGKTTMVLESLVPALRSCMPDRDGASDALPRHVTSIDPAGIERVKLVDSTPIGVNVRSTVATYSGIMDLLRRAFAGTAGARARRWTMSAFSYNTGGLRCPQCDGTGQISLDVQFLLDVTIECPACSGTRYRREIGEARLSIPGSETDLTLPRTLDLSVSDALRLFDAGAGGRGRARPAAAMARFVRDLRTLDDLGLGYLTLGEDTPSLSGGEAQRLKLSNELGRNQGRSLFVLDEPTTGLHPLDVRTLIDVLQRLVGGGATVVFIEHDLDMIANADYVIDMGPGGGGEGGRIVSMGAPEHVAADPASVTGRYLAAHCARA